LRGQSLPEQDCVNRSRIGDWSAGIGRIIEHRLSPFGPPIAIFVSHDFYERH
jgi:hypothetical protein